MRLQSCPPGKAGDPSRTLDGGPTILCACGVQEQVVTPLLEGMIPSRHSELKRPQTCYAVMVALQAEGVLGDVSGLVSGKRKGTSQLFRRKEVPPCRRERRPECASSGSLDQGAMNYCRGLEPVGGRGSGGPEASLGAEMRERLGSLLPGRDRIGGPGSLERGAIRGVF